MPAMLWHRGEDSGLLAHMYSTASRNTFRHDDTNRGAAQGHVTHGFSEIMAMGMTMRNLVLQQASISTNHEEITPALAELLVAEAQEFEKYALDLRALVDDCQDGVQEMHPSGGPGMRSAQFFFSQWVDLTLELADLCEDLGETLALSAHKPFRDLVQAELRAANMT
ncbi:MAG: hypothetical protein OXI95_03570 [bacterium]|nr:hypothetical protein [bacterium]